jgi:HAD superfamily hydrolase (TIGR01509 family)
MRLPCQPAAVVFDMDGLLFDTESIYERAALLAAAELGAKMDIAFFRSTIGSPWTAIRERLVDLYGPTFAVDELRAVAGRIFNELAEADLPLKPGVLELLDLLDTLGLRRAIATSSSRETVRRHLEAHGMVDRFHHVVAHDDCERHKPEPDPFLKAAGLLSVAPSLCLALEDSHMGVRAASAAGMMTIMIPDLILATEEIRGLCTHVVDDLHAVRLLLETDCQRTGETSSEP